MKDNTTPQASCNGSQGCRIIILPTCITNVDTWGKVKKAA